MLIVAEKLYVITEHFKTTQFNYVTASSKAEALEKVIDGEYDWTEVGDVYPTRSMTVRDVQVAKS